MQCQYQLIFFQDITILSLLLADSSNRVAQLLRNVIRIYLLRWDLTSILQSVRCTRRKEEYWGHWKRVVNAVAI